MDGDAPLNSEDELNEAARRRRLDRFDDAAADDARMEVRREEHSTE